MQSVARIVQCNKTIKLFEGQNCAICLTECNQVWYTADIRKGFEDRDWNLFCNLPVTLLATGNAVQTNPFAKMIHYIVFKLAQLWRTWISSNSYCNYHSENLLYILQFKSQGMEMYVFTSTVFNLWDPCATTQPQSWESRRISSSSSLWQQVPVHSGSSLNAVAAFTKHPIKTAIPGVPGMANHKETSLWSTADAARQKQFDSYCDKEQACSNERNHRHLQHWTRHTAPSHSNCGLYAVVAILSLFSQSVYCISITKKGLPQIPGLLTTLKYFMEAVIQVKVSPNWNPWSSHLCQTETCLM